MRTYLAYIRVSTARQGSGVSLQEQQAAIEAYAARQNFNIGAWYTELETAAKQGRREFNRMLADVRRGRAEGVIIHKIDRSARNLKDWAQLGDLIDAGVEIHFAHESLDLKSRGGRLAADIQAVVAADFIRNLREETRKGFYGRLKQGLYPLAAPRGYLDQGGGKAKTIDPVEGPLVRKAFDLYESGQFGLLGLIEVMHERGLRTRRGKPLSRKGMAGILHNSFYAGVIRVHSTGETFPGVHEPLVTMRQFERVQATLAGRVYARPLRHEFALRRLARCRCGRTLTGERQKGRDYYRCREPECRGTCFSEARLLDVVRLQLMRLQIEDEAEVEDMKSLIEAQAASERDEQSVRRNRLNRDLGAVADRLTRLTDALLDGSIDKTAFDERRAILLNDQRRIKDDIEGRVELFWERLREQCELGITALRAFNLGTPAEQAEIVKEVSANFVASPNGAVFSLDFPYSVVADWNENRRCDPRHPKVRTVDGLIRDLAAHAGDLPDVPIVPEVSDG